VTAVLSQILTDAQARITTITGLTFAVGARNLAVNAAPPRVVWVPTRDLIGPKEHSSRIAPSLYTRQAGVQAHCWGASLEAAETLVSAVIAALHESARGSVQFAGIEWASPETVTRGELAILTLSLSIPVLKLSTSTPQTVTIEAVADESTGAVAGDGILVSGES